MTGYFWDEKSLLHIKKVCFGGTGVDPNVVFPDHCYSVTTSIYTKTCACWCFVTISREMANINEETDEPQRINLRILEQESSYLQNENTWNTPDKRNIKALLRKIPFG